MYRFGPFQVDPRAHELRRSGIRLKVQEQPFVVLLKLLERPGELVTREELRSTIWPADTFVDFETGLNTVIKRLREVLRDSAEVPLFIETVPKLGYRFIAPVERFDPERAATAASAKKRHISAATKWTVPAAILLAVAAIAVLGWRLYRFRHPLVLIDKDTIVLGDFANSTGDPVFDGTLREGLSVQLEQSPFLSLVSEEGIHQTLRLMGQPANARLTPEIAREICQRTGSTTSLTGSIARIGSKYELILKATNCVSGDLLASTEAQANDKTHVLDELGSVASEMRSKLGESSSTVRKYSTPLEQVTTPSLEALQAYSLGLNTDNVAASLAFFQKATQLDPNFAMAYWAMGIWYSMIGENVLAAENSRKAFDLRARVSDRERLHIETDYYGLTLGDVVNALRSSELGAQMYPRDPTFHNALAVYSRPLGQYEAALKESLELRRLSPDGVPYANVAFDYLLLNRVEDAYAAAKEGQAKSSYSALVPVMYAIAFYRGDTAEMARQVANAANKPAVEDLLLAFEADTAAYSGHIEKAREFSWEAAESAERAGKRATAATYYAVSALRDAMFGYTDKGRQQAAIARKRGSGRRDIDYSVAVALAYAGDGNPAKALADDLARTYPQDTIVQFNYLPTLRGKLALARSNPQEAVEILKVAIPYELGAVGLPWPNIYPVYVRGEAYLAAHSGREAAAEFQKILDHRGIVLNEAIGALAHLQLGRAYVLQGDNTKARPAYEDFLALWKDADPDIPILKEARAEYVKLK